MLQMCYGINVKRNLNLKSRNDGEHVVVEPTPPGINEMNSFVKIKSTFFYLLIKLTSLNVHRIDFVRLTFTIVNSRSAKPVGYYIFFC